MRLAKNVKGIDGRMDRQGGNEVAVSEVKDKGEEAGQFRYLLMFSGGHGPCTPPATVSKII